MGGNTSPHLEPHDVIIDYMPNNAKARYWIFTLNNPSKELQTYAEQLNRANIKYAMQIETGESGTRHLQALLRWPNQIRFNTAASIFNPERPHVEKAADPKRAREYCTKRETRTEGPVCTIAENDIGSGARTDLGSAVQAIKEGASIKRIAEDHGELFVKYSRGKPLIG